MTITKVLTDAYGETYWYHSIPDPNGYYNCKYKI